MEITIPTIEEIIVSMVKTVEGGTIENICIKDHPSKNPINPI
jgi:hypothetical protein